MPIMSSSDRWLRITDAPTTAEPLIPVAFDGEEAMSELFSYRLEMRSKDDAIEPDDVLGKRLTFEISFPGDDPRVFNGVIKSFHVGRIFGSHRTYHAELVPWTWFLSRTSDCKIFQGPNDDDGKSVKTIIEEVFQEYGFSDFQFKLGGTHPKHNYRVQYRETDLDFICRLMEEEGIFFYYTHEDRKHTMVIADDKSAYYKLPEYSVDVRDDELRSGAITGFSHRYEFLSGKWTQRDYDFKDPPKNLETPKETILKTPELSNYEFYDYPGGYTKKSDGDALSKLRMEGEEVSYAVTDGNGTCRTFSPGGKFEIKSHHIKTEIGKKYAVTSTSHAASDYTGYEHAGPPSYSNSFTCIPDEVTYRNPRQTPRPVVRGPQTAVVVGTSGEEIDCDEYGRIKVQFHWDRLGANDERSSCWIRVAQMMAGPKWGTVFTPRIGMEVVVDFLEGDPDKPMCTGVVYNKVNMPPYGLPANKTQSGFKSLSSKEGSVASNYNELRFEDKKDAEEILIHAEKDMNRVVENNDTLKVGFDKMDDGDQTIEIYHNRDVTIGNDQTIKVGYELADPGDLTLEVNNDRTTTIGNADTLTVESGDRTLNVDSGDRTTTVGSGKDTLEAATSIELICGGSSIKLEPAKITIKSVQIAIEADGTLDAKSAMTTVEGSGMLTLKGGMVMVN